MVLNNHVNPCKIGLANNTSAPPFGRVKALEIY
jgi:hypothetical protein